jgi:pyruvate dehydrogenase E2 component (dihydrolipoyllysine-residue acetyltransferase)
MDGTLVEQTRMRAGIARRMVESKQQAPHFYVQTEVVVDGVRSRLAELSADDGAPRTTMTVALVRACVAALKSHPRFNSVWTPDGLLQADEINVGIAISLDDGLVAPALLGADRLDVPATAAALRDLVARARSQRLRPAELGGATFTLSNLGMFEVTAFTAIVTPPQVAILATARPVERWLVAGDEPVRGSVMTATLNADHRAVDGVDAARFLETFKQAMEDPEALLPEQADSKEATP